MCLKFYRVKLVLTDDKTGKTVWQMTQGDAVTAIKKWKRLRLMNNMWFFHRIAQGIFN